MLIPQDTIDEVKNYPLLQFIQMFVKLDRKNGNYVGLCPFHDEKSGSFDVSPSKGLYKCFGCDKTGHNPIDFMMHLENISFIDAVKRCTEILNITTGNGQKKTIQTTSTPKWLSVKKSFDFIPFETIQKNIAALTRNNLYQFLSEKFGRNQADYLFKLYNVGSCSRYGEGTTLFAQQDINGNYRQAKAMMYDSIIGKRNKQFDPIYIGRNILVANGKPYDEINLMQCFFGEHLLNGNNKHVAIVESEKSSLISHLFYPSYIWLATGGKNGCRWYSKEVSNVLKGRDIFLFPDVDGREEWIIKAEELKVNTGCRVTVIDIMNGQPPPGGYEKYDIADLLIDLGEQPPPLSITIDFEQIKSFPIEAIYSDYKVQTIKINSSEFYDILFTTEGEPLLKTELEGFATGMFCGNECLIKITEQLN